MAKDDKNNNDDLGHLEFEGMSPLAQDAANMHELFLALMEAGFNEDQALRLVAMLVDQPDTESVHFHFDGEMSNDIMHDLEEDED